MISTQMFSSHAKPQLQGSGSILQAEQAAFWDPVAGVSCDLGRIKQWMEKARHPPADG